MLRKDAKHRMRSGLSDRDVAEDRAAARIARVRRAIARGSYITEDKLDVVAEKLAGLLLRPTRRRRASA